MFADPETFWLSVTNVGLGLVTLAACVVAGCAVLREFVRRLAISRGETRELVHVSRTRLCNTEAASGAD